jgi:curved DNA-binding protein CbpA
MRLPRVLGWLAVLAVAVDAQARKSTRYCGQHDCYEIIGLDASSKSSVTEREVKRAYRDQSMVWHPDKSADPRATEIFAQIGIAYGVLVDERKKKAYDYFLDHPLDRLMNDAMYLHAVYAPKTDFRLIVLFSTLAISILQLLVATKRHNQALAGYAKTDEVEKAAQAILDERKSTRGADGSTKGKYHEHAPAHGYATHATKKFSQKSLAKDRVELDAIAVELTKLAQREEGLCSALAPRLQDTLLVQLPTLPFAAYNWTAAQVRWTYKFKLCGDEYGPEEREYLTRKAVGMTLQGWDEADEDRREALIAKELWVTKNYVEAVKEKEFEFRAKHPNRWQHHVRQRRNQDRKAYGAGNMQ